MILVVVVAVGTLVLTVIASLVGMGIGRRFEGGLSEGARSQLFGIQTSLLGLLALLLSFSFAMADQRYDLRMRLTLEEANAIGTTSLRSRASFGRAPRASRRTIHVRFRRACSCSR